MERNEILLGVMEAFDRIVSLTYQVNRIQAENVELHNKLNKKSGEIPFIETDFKVLQYGRSAIYNECTWEARIKAKRKGSEIVYTPFYDFATEKIAQLPQFMSKDTFISYFCDELERDYEIAKKDALQRIESDEADAS